ncbi:MAG TPA: bifunctional diguanylate cyclase/phosphodiesterase [Gammaproteobacteria bacterium]|nr:bifunctional diguanylate cyclase/phosphodiesterase [Gammaproteobacteria bacterium]
MDVNSAFQTLTQAGSAPSLLRSNSTYLHQQAPIALFTINPDGYFTSFEGEVFSQFNLHKEGIIGTSIFAENSLFLPLSNIIKNALNGERASTNLALFNANFLLWFSPQFIGDVVSEVSVACIENTKNEKTALSLREKEAQYLLLAEHTTDLITKYSSDGVCTYASPTAAKILGYHPEELLGKTVFHFFHPEDLKSKRRFFTKLLDKPKDSICYRVRRKDDTYIWLETTSKAVIDGDSGETLEIIAVSRDITERKETEERLLYLANYDSLTGLPNRALFRDRLRRSVARAQRNETKVALFFIDLDRFKTINDSLGHHAGDQLLRSVSRRLKQYARKGDTIARLGGDEFTIILEGIKDPEDASIVAEKILELMEPSFKLDGHQIVVSPSIGITIFPDDADDMRSLLKNADTAMYRSKDRGGNCFQFYTSDMNAKAYEYLVLEHDLRHALEREEFRLYFQPQIDLHTQNIIGVEALLRWQHPERGLLNPEEFIPFAEETGLVEPIGQWVLKNACEQAKRWQNTGLPAVRVAVNLSMRQFVAENFVGQVASILEDTNLPAQYLELELTERFLARDVNQAEEILRDLHGLGVQLSIDDFGTGYSSLSYLKRYPLNTLKIDKSFVRDISTENDGGIIVEAIIAMGQSLKLNVIAEGVETDEQTCFLRGRGCDWVQGYLFSVPLCANEIVLWLQKNNANQVQFEQSALWPETALV